MKVEFIKQNISRLNKQNVIKVLESGFLGLGQTVKKFEEDFSEFLGVNNAIGVLTGTAALHVALAALNINKGDEVITTPMSYVATANAIEYVGAKPVFVDVNKKTGNIEESKIEQAITKKTKAIIPVHLYGQMCDMRTISKIAKKYKLAVVEDAAHAVESERDGYKPGHLSDAACFSFQALKNITCGEGGTVVANNKTLSERLRILRFHGIARPPHDHKKKLYGHYELIELGWKYNMFEIQASLLLDQLNNILGRWKRRRRVVKKYEKAFKNHPIIEIIKTLPGLKSGHHLFTILVPPSKRDKLLYQLQEKGVGVGVNFRPIHLMQYYRKKYCYKEGAFPNAEYIGARTISLPMYPRLRSKEQKYVVDTVNKLLGTF